MAQRLNKKTYAAPGIRNQSPRTPTTLQRRWCCKTASASQSQQYDRCRRSITSWLLQRRHRRGIGVHWSHHSGGHHPLATQLTFLKHLLLPPLPPLLIAAARQGCSAAALAAQQRAPRLAAACHESAGHPSTRDEHRFGIWDWAPNTATLLHAGGVTVCQEQSWVGGGGRWPVATP